jgi:hypothetical protein
MNCPPKSFSFSETLSKAREGSERVGGNTGRRRAALAEQLQLSDTELSDLLEGAECGSERASMNAPDEMRSANLDNLS